MRLGFLARTDLVSVLLLVSLGSARSSAFDGRRQGFTLGLHAGAGRIQRSTSGSTSGIATQFQLGWGLSESFRVCSTTQADLRWQSATSLYQYSTLSLEGGSTTADLTYYPGGATGRWFGLVGVGVGSLNPGSPSLAYHVGLGWDFWRGGQLQWSIARYGGAEDHNVSDRFLLGWCWR